MKYFKSFLTLLLVIFFGSFINMVFASEPVQAPVFEDGEYWVFRAKEWDWISSSSSALIGDYKVIYKSGVFNIYIKDTMQEIRSGPILSHFGKGTAYGGGECFLDFPLAMGNKKECKYEIVLVGQRDREGKLRFQAETSALGMEKVAVQAGEFDSVKLLRVDYDGGYGTWQFTYYYSPQTKSIIKYLYDSSLKSGKGGKRSIELVAYGKE
ncbi:MAG: hypothetical protein EXR70_17520 [Deltaproteobacteria bacterium]|nr:hypothetical protein [Deltaproteobacteria bacterium]